MKEPIVVHSYKDIPEATKGFPVASLSVARTILKCGGYSQAWFLHQNQFTKFMYVWRTEYDALHKKADA